jgi:predicted nucleotidyltransferase component of viral defense system
MQITVRILRNWADEGGIPDLTLAELDYRLVHALSAIYTDPFLRDRLYLKGGTALNKLYLPGANRLSVDLDFNAVGTKEQVLQERTPILDGPIYITFVDDGGRTPGYRKTRPSLRN